MKNILFLGLCFASLALSTTSNGNGVAQHEEKESVNVLVVEMGRPIDFTAHDLINYDAVVIETTVLHETEVKYIEPYQLATIPASYSVYHRKLVRFMKPENTKLNKEYRVFDIGHIITGGKHYAQMV